MATLNGGITRDVELIRVSGTLPEPGTFFTIDSEAFKANGAARGANGRSFTRDYLAVDRGVAGTTKATHSNGATLTPYYPDAPGGTGSGGVTVTGSQGGSVEATSIAMPGLVADLGGGVAGVGLIVQQIGPFHIDHDRAGLGDNASSFASLDANTVVLRVWGEHITEWDGPQSGDELIIGLRGTGATTNQYVTLILLDLNSTVPDPHPGVVIEGIFHDPTAWPLIGRLRADGPGDLVVDAILTSVGTTGRTDIYAIIATPA